MNFCHDYDDHNMIMISFFSQFWLLFQNYDVVSHGYIGLCHNFRRNYDKVQCDSERIHEKSFWNKFKIITEKVKIMI